MSHVDAPGRSSDGLSTLELGDLSSEGAAIAVRTRLCVPPFAVVAKGDNAFSLEQIIRALLAQEVGKAEAAEARISRTSVEIRDPERPSNGVLTRISRTSAAMPAHTDSSYTTHPHQLVVFEMLRAETHGGDSVLVPAASVDEQLSADARLRLQMPVYPFGNKRFPCLTYHRDGPRIRYYRAQIDKGISLGHPLPEACLKAMEEVDRILSDTRIQIRRKLMEGEALFIANTRVLHGRTALPSNSDRLMVRYRARSPSLG